MQSALPLFVCACSERAESFRRALGADVPAHWVRELSELRRRLRKGEVESLVVESRPPQFDGLLLVGSVREEIGHLPLVVVAPNVNGEIVNRAREFGASDVVDEIDLSHLPGALDRGRAAMRLHREYEQTTSLLRRQAHALGERIKELNCLYGISRVVESCDLASEEPIPRILELIPPAWQYPAITCARATLGERVYRTERFRQTEWRQSAPIRMEGRTIGSLDVFYTERRPLLDEGPFLAEERSLIDVIAERLGRIIHRKKVDEAIRRHQRLLEESRRALKVFSGRILSVREEEKKKIANTLHDELGSITVDLTARLSVAEETLREGEAETAIEAIRGTKESLLRYVENLKRLAKDLRPPDMDILGLPGALRELVALVASRKNLRIDLRIEPAELDVHEEVAIAAYRVTQEALSNVVEHARAARVSVDLELKKNRLHLSVADDGCGFVLEEPAASDRIGVRGMRERVESLGGIFRVESIVGRGTAVRAVLPTG